MSAPTLLAPPKRIWTDEQRQEVKALLAKGASAAGVARKMGLNRNQVLGRIYRDPELALRSFLPKPKKTTPPKSPKVTSPTSANVVMVAKAGSDVVRGAPPAAAPVVTTPEPPNHPNAMALIGTGTHWCKWPVARDSRVLGGFLCCGNRSLSNDVYCAHHRGIARGKAAKRAAPT